MGINLQNPALVKPNVEPLKRKFLLLYFSLVCTFWLKHSRVHLLWSTNCSSAALQRTGQFTGDERGKQGSGNHWLSADPNPPLFSPLLALTDLDLQTLLGEEKLLIVHFVCSVDVLKRYWTIVPVFSLNHVPHNFCFLFFCLAHCSSLSFVCLP